MKIITDHSNSAPNADCDKSIKSPKIVLEAFSRLRTSGSICLISKNPFAHIELYVCLTSYKLNVVHLDTDVFKNNPFAIRNLKAACLLIDVDHFEDIGQIFKQIQAVRFCHPGIIVILTSQRFKNHDLTKERLPICDVSLRNPFSPSEFELGFADASSNNDSWQKRLKELANETTYKGTNKRRRDDLKLVSNNL
jgi:hypothetical protein